MDHAAQPRRTHDAEGNALTPEQQQVMWEGGTEAPFTGAYWNTHASGMYACASCGAELFASDAKFDSGTGWPSFTDPANRSRVKLVEDTSHGVHRTEVCCAHCDAHLGHVFDDGPRDRGGKRYCINSVCLHLRKPNTP
ncbi:peptide-methionine (R)-S-oxide reductase MsrB [Candidatus Uhrbacteria bacterium]|nr:peptide-methionine (R)-S-oxide reductase MsrB [Candidatus Uhrbacteria bacterium]